MKQERATIISFMQTITAGNNAFPVLMLLFSAPADPVPQSNCHAKRTTIQEEVRKTPPTSTKYCRLFSGPDLSCTRTDQEIRLLLTYLCIRECVALPPTSGTSRFNVSVNSPTGLPTAETSTTSLRDTSLLSPNWSIAI